MDGTTERYGLTVIKIRRPKSGVGRSGSSEAVREGSVLSLSPWLVDAFSMFTSLSPCVLNQRQISSFYKDKFYWVRTHSNDLISI